MKKSPGRLRELKVDQIAVYSQVPTSGFRVEGARVGLLERVSGHSWSPEAQGYFGPRKSFEHGTLSPLRAPGKLRGP